MTGFDLHDLGVTLRNRDVFRDVSLTISAGEMVGLIGPNGAGKTSLMRAALGLVPHVGHSALAQMNARDRARAVAWMPQSREIAWPVTVERLVALGRLPHLPPTGSIPTKDRALIDQAIDRLDLGALRLRAASRLSGGGTSARFDRAGGCARYPCSDGR